VRLESGETDEDLKPLLQEAHQKMLQVHGSGAYARIGDDPPPDLEAARQCLLHQGMLLLETLRSQDQTAERRGRGSFAPKGPKGASHK